MTEHSYGSTQGNETSLAVMLTKGKVDRRYDHQYAIVGDGESQAKGDVKKVKVEGRRVCHDDSCPVYNTPKRRALVQAKMDRNNNGEGSASAAPALLESVPGNDAGIDQLHGGVALIHVGNPQAIETPQGELVASLGTPLNNNCSCLHKSSSASLDSPLQVHHTSEGDISNSVEPQVVQLVLLPEQTKVKEESDIKVHYNLLSSIDQPCAISQVSNDSIDDEAHSPVEETCIDTKDHITKIMDTFDPVQESNSNAAPPAVCSCKVESLDIVKVRAAEKVLARQGRLVKRVAALQRQLTRQKHSHEVEIEKLMKRFHELEEKFDLTRSILRSCIGDDQFTVYASQNSRGVIWSKKTLDKAMQLRSSCGPAGYKAISKLLIPLPSDRTLQRYNQKSKHESIYVEVKDTSED